MDYFFDLVFAALLLLLLLGFLCKIGLLCGANKNFFAIMYITIPPILLL